jgi:hypothetical protein
MGLRRSISWCCDFYLQNLCSGTQVCAVAIPGVTIWQLLSCFLTDEMIWIFTHKINLQVYFVRLIRVFAVVEIDYQYFELSQP